MKRETVVRTSLWGLLLGAVILLGGCQPSIQVDRRAAPVEQVRAKGPRPSGIHDLVLLAVDFDPPLDQLPLAAGQEVTLMAAIQNGGRAVERDVTITARLYDVEAQGAQPVLLLESRAYLAQIEPGEVAIVRFDPLRSLPMRSHYFLNVEVAAVAGEGRPTDTSQTFEIVIRPPTVPIEGTGR